MSNAMKYQAALMTPEDDVAWVTNWLYVACVMGLPQFSGLGDNALGVMEKQMPVDRLAKVINAYDFDRDHHWGATHGMQLDIMGGQVTWCLWKHGDLATTRTLF